MDIDPWAAIGFALDNIDDHFDRLRFLKLVQDGDYLTLGDEFPEFQAVYP